MLDRAEIAGRQFDHEALIAIGARAPGFGTEQRRWHHRRGSEQKTSSVHGKTWIHGATALRRRRIPAPQS
jgi:hypothetical protein